MKNGILKITLFLCFTLATQVAFAQGAGESGSNILLYSIIGVAILLIFGLILSLSNNQLSLQAKSTGADRTGANTSLFPRWNEIVRPKLPAHLTNQPVHVLSEGHDIFLQGEAEKETIANKSTRYAVQPPNFVGMSPIPKVTVAVGDTVKAGDALFFDKKRPEIIFTAPVSGEVIEINRGEKRSIVSVVILADKDQQFKSFEVPNLNTAKREDVVKLLLESGAWTMIKQRPYNITPAPADIPRDIFVSTFDSAPNAPCGDYLVAGRAAAFQRGLDALAKLTEGKVHLGLDAKNETPSNAFVNASGVAKHWFHGKHPYGNVGIQIHHVNPMSTADKVWTLGVQEVLTIGELFLSGKYDTTRLVAVTGAQFETNNYVKTYLGANIGDLVKDNLKFEEGVRLVAGDILSGSATSTDGYLNFFDDQVTVLEEGNKYEMFGWLLPFSPRPTVSNTFPNFLYPKLKFNPNTNTHGEKRAFVVTGEYEKVLPMDVYPQHIFKSIIVNDFERMEGLGTYELVEEDVALCEFVCTSKQPLQKILRDGLEYMREQG